MKEIDKIIKSTTPPKSKDVLWDNGKELLINRNGKWEKANTTEIKEGSIPLSALAPEVKDKIENAGGGAYITNSGVAREDPLIADENEYFDFLCKIGYAYHNNELFNLPQLVSEKGKNVLYNIADFDYGVNDDGELLGFRINIIVIHFSWQSDTNSFLTEIKNRILRVNVWDKSIEVVGLLDKEVRIPTDNI